MKNFICGSGWKMVNNYQDSIRIAGELQERLRDFHDYPVVIFPSFPVIPEIIKLIDPDSVIKIGGQDMFWELDGAYTGEVSGQMLLDIGCKYVEINHQERRRYLKEDNRMSNLKLKTAVKIGLRPFLCIGEETKGSDEQTQQFLQKQLSELLDGISKEQVQLITFAYEPMWAIGKKDTAELSHIQKVHHYIRSVIADFYDTETAMNTYIVYGGGINMETYLDIAALPDVNGLFTTGCGVNPETYSKLAITTAKMLKKMS